MSTRSENSSNNMHGPTADYGPNPPTAPGTVVGIYGVPGSGKSFHLKNLKQKNGQDHFAFFEGSEKIADLVPGGLEAFKSLEAQEKAYWRQLAIESIAKECAESGKVAVVAGHFMFWPEGEEAGWPVYTRNDLQTFTHILYLDVPAGVIAQRRLDDTKSRPAVSVAHLQRWQQAEKTQLRSLCLQHGILFLPLPHLASLNKASMLLCDFRQHTEKYNMYRAERRLDDLFASQGQLETMLVIDADRTLATEDTGELFWKMASNSELSGDKEYVLKTLFGSPLGYSYTAFRQAALLYEERADDQEFDFLCQDVASAVTMHPEFVHLLQKVAEQKHVSAVVVTCGLRLVWDKVLEREGLSNTVKVIGGGRIADGFVVTAAVKASLVTRLRDSYQMYVWAFGDSPLDLDMLSKANQAIVVAGEELTRSKTMDSALMEAIDEGSLQARQVVLPSNALPRLDMAKLPLVQITEPEFVHSILCHCNRHTNIEVHIAKTNTTRLFMTPTRDAIVAGPALRKSHGRVGHYLAIEFLADMIGVEEYEIQHVQGHKTGGFRLRNEKETLIVALMRGGEALAFGVNEAFPEAMLLHATRPDDIKPDHLKGTLTVLLVDSVVNSGNTMVQFVRHVRSLHATIRIIVVTIVVQAQVLAAGSLAQRVAYHQTFDLVALRVSNNMFTGRGITDTGNRLFNTTHLP
jgi:uracil phosphoribosyltransferase/phosphoserine phosphatase/adenylate kinase